MEMELLQAPVLDVGESCQFNWYSCENIAEIIQRLKVSDDFLNKERLDAALFRVHYSTVLEGVPYHFEYVKQIVNNEKKPMERFEREIYGYHQGELMLFQRAHLPFDIHLIHDLQKIFFAFPGETPQVDLFTSKLLEERGLDLSDILNSILPELLNDIHENETMDPLTKSWHLHWNVASFGPFGSCNGKFARLLQFGYLLRHQMTLGGMLRMEQEIFKEKETYFQWIDDIKKYPTKINEAIIWGENLYQSHLKFLFNKVKSYLCKRADFDRLTPAQRIAVLKVIYKPEICAGNDQNLNDRQKELLQILYSRGVIQTKELFDAFDVNRKTLQRDFTELIHFGLVSITGEGRGVKYIVPRHNNVPEELSTFQTNFF